jgi:hypothetical protein
MLSAELKAGAMPGMAEQPHEAGALLLIPLFLAVAVFLYRILS